MRRYRNVVILRYRTIRLDLFIEKFDLHRKLKSLKESNDDYVRRYQRRLWNGANDLRGSMDASRYKDYMLGLMFYKFLSDKTLETFATTSGIKGTEEELVHAYHEAYDSYGENLIDMIQKSWVTTYNHNTYTRHG